MAECGNRPGIYIFGCCLMYLASLLYLIGFGSPYWISYSYYYSMGLWMQCVEGTGMYSRLSKPQCVSLDLTYYGSQIAWFRVVQAFQCIALIGNGMACLFCLYDNCCRSARKHTRILEIIAGCSGALGFISVMVYVGKIDSLGSDSYSWSFALDLTGCILMIISAILILVTNRPGSNEGGTIYYPPAQGGTTIVMQQGYSYPPPAATYPGGPPPQYPAGAVPQYPPAGAPQYPPAGAPQYFPAGAPQYPPGAAPQYPPAGAPQYPPAGYSQAGYTTGYSGANYPQVYSGAPEPK